MRKYINYGKKIAETLCTFGNHGVYGGRQAGSSAEHLAAAFLEKEMRKIGLSDVRREAFPCDTWEFRDARLQVLQPSNAGVDIRPYAYASGGTDLEGITAPLVYVGRGTEAEYEGVDVTGKIVLIDIDMDTDWWIDAPTMEAALHGAAAIINSCSGGYAQYSEDALNCQDFCGPLSIPSVNISRRDAARLKELCASGEVLVRLVVDNDVLPGGTSYNISGTIPGKTPDELIIIGDHYDSHFNGFQDNAAAVGLTLALAKHALDKGYTPERTLVFILHGAEEWGVIDSRYDWAVGAWNQVNRLHPEWAGRAVCYINFELPAVETASSWYLASSSEFYTWTSSVLDETAPPADCYPDGIRRDWWSITPWSDEWSYSLAGIPSFINGLMLKADGSFTDFIHTIYHSQYDNADTWNEQVFGFNFSFFSDLFRRMDGLPAVPLDFSVRGGQILSSLDPDTLETAGVDVKTLRDTLERFIDTGRTVWEKAVGINDGSASMEGGREFNARVLGAYRMAQDAFVRFTWDERPVYPHEPLQRNIGLICDALDALTEDNTAAAVEACSRVDLNYLSPHFSREVVLRTLNQTLDPAARNRQYWGSGRITSSVDLYREIHLLQSGENTGAALAMLEDKLEDLQRRLQQVVAEEVAALEKITAVLEQVV